MVELDFFVESNSKDHEEIKKMAETFDETKCSYKIHTLNQSKINGRHLPILKLTLLSGGILEYDKDSMFNLILNFVKIGI